MASSGGGGGGGGGHVPLRPPLGPALKNYELFHSHCSVTILHIRT